MKSLCKTCYNILRWATVTTLVILTTTSCSTQNLFQPKNDNDYATLDSSFFQTPVEHRIDVDDKISTSIWNHDDLSVGSLFGIYNSNEVYGKWVVVNKEGNINLPKIGTINVLGLTTTETQMRLQEMYAEYIKDPIIVVKILNREVTVLGEVKSPGNFLLEKEKNTLFEVLGRAEGLNFYANKKEVKFIRNEKEYLLDLTKMDEFTQNNIVLQKGDIIYVPSRKGKIFDKKAPNIIPLSSLVTSLVILSSFFNN